MRILIVEDNKDGADTIASLLRLWGYNPRVSSDGEAGVAEAKRFLPEVVVMDIGLPRLDGFEAATQMREALGPGVKLVALTAYSSEADRFRAQVAGFDYFLVKPTRPTTLHEILAESANGRTPQVPPAENG
jgi:DNA-binding response OmpR family regulator